MTEEKDPFEGWRNIEPRVPAVSGGKEAYAAVGKWVSARLHVCPLEHEAWEWLPYMDLQRIVHDGPHGTRIGLIWAYAVVIIKGRNLQLLDRDLADGAIGEVRAFDPKRHLELSDQTQPFIDTLTIITESRKMMIDEEVRLLSDVERRH